MHAYRRSGLARSALITLGYAARAALFESRHIGYTVLANVHLARIFGLTRHVSTPALAWSARGSAYGESVH